MLLGYYILIKINPVFSGIFDIKITLIPPAPTSRGKCYLQNCNHKCSVEKPHSVRGGGGDTLKKNTTQVHPLIF